MTLKDKDIPKPSKRAVQEAHITELVNEYDHLINKLAEPLEPITTSFKGHGANETLISISLQQLPSGDFRGITRRELVDDYGVPSREVAFTNGSGFINVLCPITQCLAHDSLSWRHDKFWKPERSVPSHLHTII